jgi:MFS family permease
MQSLSRNGDGDNARWFLRFTVLYNARAYYPVLAVLFVDLGLSLDQFVLLNLIWASVVFLFEVPSGALADTWGRRTLLLIASGLMVLEMLCLLLAPKDGGVWLFALCIVNRICSGLSEACASGADEAHTYDSLPEVGRAEAWDKLLATAMRFRSLGFVAAMVLGAFVYDPTNLNKLLPSSLSVAPGLAHRLPLLFVLGQALACVVITWRTKEARESNAALAEGDTEPKSWRTAVRLTLQTARWVATNPKTLMVVVLGMALDSIGRNFATINSSYYRMIELPDWSFGLLGAGMGALGYFVPGVAQRLNAKFSPLVNLGFAALATLAGLVGVAPAMLLMLVLGYVGFTVSRVLHHEADSDRRATVLSVKGLAFNLGYGAFSLAFSRLLVAFTKGEGAVENAVALKRALFWQAPAFALVMLALLAWGKRLEKRNAA